VRDDARPDQPGDHDAAVVVDVEVERRDGDLVVRWGLGGPAPDDAVRVSVGTSPDDIDHERPVAEVRDEREVLVAGLDPTVRHYFHVGVGGGPGVVAAERLVPLEGTLNFRDLGGYPTAGGRRVRWGRVFRSDGLGELTDADAAYLGRIGIRTIHDFRHPGERARAPSRLPADAGWRLVDLAIGEAAGERPELIELVLQGEVRAVGVDVMIDIYLGMVRDHGPTFGRLIAHLADPDGLPALFHCAAGKDRTGIAAALLLGALGVEEATILDDYELSTELRSKRRIEVLRPQLESVGVDVEAVRAFLSAPRPALAAVLAWIADEHGTVDRFLVDAAGVPDGTLDRLRELLLT
jgi:protein-tyrosine phosphatase